MTAPFVVHPPETTVHGGRAVYRVPLDGAAVDTVDIAVDAEYGELLSDRADAAAVAALVPAMATGAPLHVQGSLSAPLHRALGDGADPGPLQRVLAANNPALAPVPVAADDARPAAAPGPYVATGFSAGIDSFDVLYDAHFAPDEPPAHRLTHLLFNDVGSGRGGARLAADEARLHAAAARIGLPLVVSRTNFDSLYGGTAPDGRPAPFDRPTGFKRTHTLRNAAVALALQGAAGGPGISRWLYASAYGPSAAHLRPADDVAYADHVVVPLLSTGGLTAVSVGGDRTRVEKTLRVARLPDSYDLLDVCFKPSADRNCGTCAKCLRTALTLDLADLLDLYRNVFDLAAYRARRPSYSADVIREANPFAREIVRFARDLGRALPLQNPLWYRVWGRARSQARRWFGTA